MTQTWLTGKIHVISEKLIFRGRWLCQSVLFLSKFNYFSQVSHILLSFSMPTMCTNWHSSILLIPVFCVFNFLMLPNQPCWGFRLVFGWPFGLQFRPGRFFQAVSVRQHLRTGLWLCLQARWTTPTTADRAAVSRWLPVLVRTVPTSIRSCPPCTSMPMRWDVPSLWWCRQPVPQRSSTVNGPAATIASILWKSYGKLSIIFFGYLIRIWIYV